jgi:hypothetical protein
MNEYKTCNECYEKFCICERTKTDFENKLNQNLPKEKVSLDYELNY